MSCFARLSSPRLDSPFPLDGHMAPRAATCHAAQRHSSPFCGEVNTFYWAHRMGLSGFFEDYVSSSSAVLGAPPTRNPSDLRSDAHVSSTNLRHVSTVFFYNRSQRFDSSVLASSLARLVLDVSARSAMLLLRFLVCVVAGDYLVAEYNNHRVLLCSSTGDCTKVAGTGAVEISFSGECRVSNMSGDIVVSLRGFPFSYSLPPRLKTRGQKSRNSNTRSGERECHKNQVLVVLEAVTTSSLQTIGTTEFRCASSLHPARHAPPWQESAALDQVPDNWTILEQPPRTSTGTT